jgi:hypothetical protein
MQALLASPSAPIVLLLGMVASFIWNFAVLSSIQVTVRLLRLYSVRAMLVGALVLTAGGLPITLGYLALSDVTYDSELAQRLLESRPPAWQAYVFQNRLQWLPAAMAPMGTLGFLVVRRVLRFKRMRGAIFAALGVGILCVPWWTLFAPAP